MDAKCAWCEAPQTLGPTCQACGANYEKAARIKAGNKPEPTPRKPRSTRRQALRVHRLLDAWEPVRDPAFEHQLCLWVIPGMLGLTFVMAAVGIGDSLLRIVFGMPVHELGHAVVGWIGGFNSIPTLWKTIIPEHRGLLAPALLFAASCYLINHARLHANGGLLLIGLLLLTVQFTGTFILDVKTVQMLVTWGGDGMGMMLATGLMAGFCLDKQTGWYKGYLRWGFAFIGAAAFADIVAPWWVSLEDISAVPYGMTGGTHTDTYKLMHTYGWRMEEVINRYVMLSVCCMAVLVLFYVRGIRQAMSVVRLREDAGHEVETPG